MAETIYLDNNATTRPLPEVVDAMTRSLTEGWANPSSIHRPGAAARRHVELARESVARLVGCQDRELVFCSGGTESVNLAIFGTLEQCLPADRRPVLVTSRLEHSAVRESAEAWTRRGGEVLWAEHLPAGPISLDWLGDALRRHGQAVALVSLMWVNNETGVVQPIDAIGALCRSQNVRCHVDATQAVGRVPVDVASMQVDLLSFAAHKFHGPKGVGGLYVRRGIRLVRQAIGGPQERDRRGGTENVPAIVGMGVAADAARRWLDAGASQSTSSVKALHAVTNANANANANANVNINASVNDLGGEADPHEASRGGRAGAARPAASPTSPASPAHIAAARDRFEQSILARCPGARVNGADAPRAWSTTNIAFPRLEAEAILLLLSEQGVCASAGAACSSGSLDPSPVLLAMGIAPEYAHGSVRFSLSRFTTRDELDRATDIIANSIAKLGRSGSSVLPR